MNVLKKKPHKFLFKYQFGFRLKHSTADALINITDDIKDLMVKWSNVLGLFLDPKKAFDTVDNQILLNKFETIGIRGHALQFFNSYLTDRKQFVTINGKNSETKCITTGVPQVSVLGPLFSSYILILSNTLVNLKIVGYLQMTLVISYMTKS